jgi:hypothetical protein
VLNKLHSKKPKNPPVSIPAAMQAICLLTGDKETLENVQEKAVKMVAGLLAKDYKER